MGDVLPYLVLGALCCGAAVIGVFLGKQNGKRIAAAFAPKPINPEHKKTERLIYELGFYDKEPYRKLYQEDTRRYVYSYSSDLEISYCYAAGLYKIELTNPGYPLRDASFKSGGLYDAITWFGGYVANCGRIIPQHMVEAVEILVDSCHTTVDREIEAYKPTRPAPNDSILKDGAKSWEGISKGKKMNERFWNNYEQLISKSKQI